MNFKVFAVGETPEFIAAQTTDEAWNDHLERVGAGWYATQEELEETKADIKEIGLDQVGYFEQETGGHKEMTWAEFIGPDFVYEKPTLLCWTE